MYYHVPFKKRKFTIPEQMEVDEDDEDGDELNKSNVGNDFEMVNDVKRKKDRMNTIVQANNFVELENAFKGNLKTFYLKNTNRSVKDICMLLSLHKDEMEMIIIEQVKLFGAVKFNLLVECTYVKPNTNERQDRAFKTKNISVFVENSINSVLHSLFEKICKEESTYEGQGSGWSLLRVDGIMIRINRYRPLGGSTYIPLPTHILLKNAVINPISHDNYCFKWALLSHFVTGRNRGRIDHRYHAVCNRLNFNGIDFPTPIKQIKKFEQNNCDVSVNVYGLNETDDVYPLRVTDVEKSNHIDLLLITNNQGVSHYCYISNFSRLFSSQMSKHSHKVSVCKRCLSRFWGKSKNRKLMEHKKICCLNKPVRALMPNEDKVDPKVLKFKNTQNMFRLPIVIYADFECILKPVNEQVTKYTHVDNVHEPMSFCVYVVCSDTLPEFIKNVLPQCPYLYRGRNAAKHFMNYIVNLANIIGDCIRMHNIDMLPLTIEEQILVRTARNCEMCEKPFTSTVRPHRDHCHLTGRFRSVLCKHCNLRRQEQRNLPVFIHGTSNYDSHFIVKQLGFDQRRISVIPTSTEKYITFSKQTKSGMNIRFVDTYKIMNSSLAALVNNLSLDKFINIKKFFSETDFPLVTRKGVYPYEYTSSWNTLDETRLPPKESFRNSLLNCDISDEDYAHATNVWNHFSISTLGEYSDLYLKLDVLLLSDVFENFRDLCLESYQLDCAHYLTLPSFTFDAMLKYTKVELELLNDYNMYIFIESGIRGGITSCVKRHAVANNHYMGNAYNPNVSNSYLMYVDCNNLYGWAMAQPMPLNNFSWYTGNLNEFDVTAIPDDSEVGYFLEVDVDYPESLHDEHNDLPFLPVTECPPKSKFKKLLTTLKAKQRYICHYVNLKQAIENGLILTKIHRILQFNQSCWLKSYINLNTDKRQQAKNSFEKDFYKLLNNSMFGKTIENIRKRINLQLVSSQKRLDMLLNKPTFVDRIIYDESLCAVECAKECIYFDKPIYIGFSVLEISKTLMYDFHYKIIKPKYGSNVKVVYMDTDAFFYQILTDDFYKDLKNDTDFCDYFDLSDYPVDHMCFSSVNKKVLGKFKDECNGIMLLEFIGLRPKLYCLRTIQPVSKAFENTKEPTVQKKAKGITKGVINEEISFDDYKNCLLNDLTIRKKIKMFRSKKHVIETITCNKIALSGKDDKRFICENGIDTLAFGHYKLNTKHDDDESTD